MSFTHATSVRQQDPKLGKHFEARIHEGWDIAGNANGGYLMAIACRAMAQQGQPHPVAVSAHFLSPGRPGPVRCQPQVLKRGRQFTTVRATLSSSDKTLVELLGSFSDLSQIEGAVLIDAQPPQLPEPDQCVAMSGEGAPPLMQKLDLRLHPEDAGFAQGNPTGRPLFRGWVRFREEPIDAFGLLLIADTFPPTVFNANLPVAWTPTVEMTTHIRGIPEPGWLRCRFSTRFITGGMLEEDGEIWDESGRLVAQSRQLALIPKST